MGNLSKRKSAIHGTGIFAGRDIEKEEIFYNVPMDSIFDKPRFRCAYIGKNRWVDDEEILNYINHSCDCNSILDISDEPKLIAKKKIKVGEEITVDYDQTEKGGVKIVCHCGSVNCRGYFLRKE